MMGIDSHDCNRIVVKDCRDIFRGEFVGGVTNEEAGLANRTIANNNASVGKNLVSSSILVMYAYKFVEVFVVKRAGSQRQTYLMVGLIFVERLGEWTLGDGMSASMKAAVS